jgi:hypothetical protein
MEKIYKNQGKFDLYLDTEVDATGSLNMSIDYETPTGNLGSFPAILSDTNTTLCHHFIDGELNEAGTWKFWSNVTYSDDRSATGQPVRIKIYEVGE